MQELLDKWGIKIKYDIILNMWNESHRGYHTQNHLLDLIDQINNIKSTLSESEYEKLILCALFHDIVYDPMRQDNEEKSAAFFNSCCSPDNALYYKMKDVKEVEQMILDTKAHEATSKLSKLFNQLDMNIVERDLDSLLEWEQGIYHEFKGYGNTMYKQGRLAFLESLLDKYPNNSENILKLIDYVKNSYNE